MIRSVRGTAIAVAALTAAFAFAAPFASPAQTRVTPPQAQGGAETSAPAAAPEDPAVTARAKNILQGVQADAVDRTQLSDEFNKALTPEKLSSASSTLAAFGTPVEYVYDGKYAQGATTLYLYHVRLDKGRFDEVMAVDPDGRISGLLFGNAELDATSAPSGGTP